MHLGRFSDDAGEAASRPAVEAAAALEASFFWGELRVAASSLLLAMEEGDNLLFSQQNGDVLSSFQEVRYGSQIAAVGSFALTEDGLPTAIEVALCKYLLYSDVEPELDSGLNICFYSKSLESHPARSIILKAFGCGQSTIFHKNSAFTISEGNNIYINRSKVFIEQSYDFYKTKYGFLELYRSLESGFIEAILVTLNREYSKNPVAALDKAKESLSKERAQLAALVAGGGNESLLQAIARDFDNIKLGGARQNAFAVELEKKNKKDNSGQITGIDKNAWRGAWIIYQIRCSIAHAGTSGIVFEDFSDGMELIDKLYDHVEHIALSMVGIDFTL